MSAALCTPNASRSRGSYYLIAHTIMKKRKVIKVIWIILSLIVVLSMVAWTVGVGFTY